MESTVDKPSWWVGRPVPPMSGCWRTGLERSGTQTCFPWNLRVLAKICVGELEQRVDPPVTRVIRHDLDFFVAPANYVDKLLPQMTPCHFDWTHSTSLHQNRVHTAQQLPSCTPWRGWGIGTCDTGKWTAFRSLQGDAGPSGQRDGSQRPKLWPHCSH